MTRWPLEPLHALARTRDGERLSLKALSLRLGLNPSTVQQWAKRGIPSDTKAEEAAVACGFDPYVVWGDEWTVAQEARYSKPCAECGEPFVPYQSNARFCERRCYDRWYVRNRYHNDPEYRERKLAKARQYKAESVRAITAQRNRRAAVMAEHDRAVRRQRYLDNRESERERRKARYWQNPEAEREAWRRRAARKEAELKEAG